MLIGEDDGLHPVAEAELAAGNYDAALDAFGAYRAGTTDPVARRGLALRVARALSLAGRTEEALSTFDAVLADGPSDTLAARIHLEKGEILSAIGDGGRAGDEYAQVARLAAGTPVAAEATLRRGRLEWEAGRRDEALPVLLDAFLHAPTTVWADSARAEAFQKGFLPAFKGGRVAVLADKGLVRLLPGRKG